MSKLCFDIGANIGKWSSANKDKFDKIISVEASPDTFKVLLDKTASIDNVFCLNYAVCNNNNQEVQFHSSSIDTLSTLNAEYTTITCASITLDKLIEHYGTPDLIKIDVESGEYLTISSLSTRVPSICFEWAAEMNEVSLKCLDHLSQLGFDKYYIQYEDNYTFRPNQSDYKTLDQIKTELLKSVPKNNWGMIWAM